MPRDLRFWAISLLILLFFGVLGLYVVPNWSLWFQTPEQRVSYLYESVWCPICEGETIATSQTEVSRELRREIRRMVEAGKTNRQIYQYVEDNYGPGQVALPRRGWMDRLSYALPYLVMGLVAVGVFAMAWRWTKASRGGMEDGEDDPSEETRQRIEELAHREGPLG